MPAKKDPFAQPQLQTFGRTADFKPVTSSTVQTASPFTGSQVRQYSTSAPSYYGFGQNAGDKSRQAFSYAAQLQRQNQATGAMDAMARQYQTQQQQTRATDLASQRADQVRRYGMDEDYLNKRRSMETRRREEISDVGLQQQIAKKNRDANFAEQLTGLAISGFMPAFGATLLDTAKTRGGSFGQEMFNPDRFSGAFMGNLRSSLLR